MFCPFCGIKNNAEQTSCFICSKKLPSLDDAPVARFKSALPARPSVTTAPVARMRDRLVAVLLDLLFVAAALLVSGAALWSQVKVIRDVNQGAIAATAATAAALLIFVYNWIAEVAFGATIGKAFAGVRVVRRERPLSVLARSGVIALWLVGVSAAVWGTFVICPQWFGR